MVHTGATELTTLTMGLVKTTHGHDGPQHPGTFPTKSIGTYVVEVWV